MTISAGSGRTMRIFIVHARAQQLHGALTRTAEPRPRLGTKLAGHNEGSVAWSGFSWN